MTTEDASEAADGAVPAPACAMVIFGGAGDLTKRLVMPALYNLSCSKRLSDGFRIVGVDLASLTTEVWRDNLTEMMNAFVAQGDASGAAGLDQAGWRFLTERMSYLQGDLTNPETYRRLGEHLATPDKSAARAGQPYILSRDRGSLFRHGGRGPGRRRVDGGEGRPMASRGDRETFRPRSRVGQGAQRRDPEDDAGEPDLSDRPFSRQGNGAEHHGAAIRQRSV